MSGKRKRCFRWMSAANWRASKQRIGNKPYLHVIDQFEAVDIDTAEDFEFAKAVAMYKESLKNNN